MKAGEEEGFTALYRRRQGAVCRFALRMSGNPAVAEEVTQEAFMVLVRSPNQFDPARGSLAAFLIGVAAVVLCDLEELSYEEAAATLDCAVGTIRSRLHRGRALLLAKLEVLRQPARLNARKASG